MPISLGALATQFGCELIGDPDAVVSGVSSLAHAQSGSLTFLSNPSYRKYLSSTEATAVIVCAEDAAQLSTAAIIHEDPYACYARMAAVICPPPVYEPGIHPTAVIDASSTVADSAHLAPNVVIGENSRVGENVYIGPGCVIGPDCSIGDDCRLIANVTLARSVRIGARCIFHPSVVIGSDGFGNAKELEGWVKVPQLGGVRIGNDVEIGAGTTVDCGALDDTVLEDGVRIDNLCMVGHNVHIGAHTAMAATSAIAGSAIIGKRCMIAGMSGVNGHVTVCDDVIISAKTFLSKDVKIPGRYAGNFPAINAADWARQVGRFRRLDKLIERVRKIEKRKG